jgi:transketolase
LKSSDRPSLIICKTTIGWGAPNLAGSHEVHGAPLGAAEAGATRAALAWEHGPFEISPELRALWDARPAGREAQARWNETYARYTQRYPDEAAEFARRMRGELPQDWNAIAESMLQAARRAPGASATRQASQRALETLVGALPELLGGSADLTGSNLTRVDASKLVGADAPGNYICYGVREFGMAAIMNGIALHGGFIPYGGTFAVFSDYARNAIRMSALMRQRVVHVLTHDSIGLGEDGPTHQPVEHATMLRATPNLDVWRPCDAVETAVAWRSAIERRDGPSALLLSRQALPRIDAVNPGRAARGGYILSESPGALDVLLIATGSEVALALEAQRLLAEQGLGARVVSMPSTSVFDRQDEAWRAHVLPRGVRRVAVEAAHPDFWRKYVGLEGAVIGVASFGESAPAKDLFAHFGITAAEVTRAALSLLPEEKALCP